MNPRMILSLVVISVASGAAGIGLFAFFTDQVQSTNNIFTAGTVDLKVNGADSVGAFIGGGNMKPGDCVTGSVDLSSASSLSPGDMDLDVAINVVNNKGADGLGDMPRFLRIATISYMGNPIVLSNVNGNGFVDLGDWDASNSGTTDLLTPGAGYGSGTFSLQVCLDSSAGNELQGDSVNLTVYFQLAQAVAPDLSANP